jgi:hypothetical protein
MVSSERWVCRQCFADNEGDATHCSRCGLARFAGAGDAVRDPMAPPDDPNAADGSPMPQWSPQPPPSKPFWQRLIPFWWVGLIAVVLVGGVLFNARRDEGGAITDGGTLHVNELQVGDCFNTDATDTIDEVDAVPCGEAHSYELFHVFTMTDGGSYPTSTEFTQQEEAACVPAFEEYVGAEFLASALYVTTIEPTEEGWDDGDHEVQCILHERDKSAVTGTQRGSNR